MPLAVSTPQDEAVYEALNSMLHCCPQEREEDHYAWLRKCAKWLVTHRGVTVTAP
jgi:hypothetical protein